MALALSRRSPPPRCSRRSRAARSARSGARWGSIWFGIGTATLLFTARLPFAIGVAFGLAALLALQRRRYALGDRVRDPLRRSAARSRGCSSRWPGVAVALAANGDRAKRLGGARDRRGRVHPAGCSSSWAFPEGGWAPFPHIGLPADPGLRDHLPDPACRASSARCAGAPRCTGSARRSRSRSRRRWAATPCASARCSAARCCCARSGAGPSGASSGWRRCWPSGFASLAFWMWSPAVRDVIKYLEDPAAKSDYFEPLRQFLYTLPDQRRIEIPFTRSHWEGAEIAPEVPLARGWLRQLDTGLNPIFYKGKINRLTYASWLADNAVRYVALPSAKPDKSSYGERALIEKGLPYLRLRWKSDDWRVYEVLLPTPIVIPQGDAQHRARAVRLGRAAARREEAGRGDRQGALDALLVRLERVRGARRRLDARDRATRSASCGCPRASRRSGCSRADGAATTVMSARCYRSRRSSSASARSGCLDAPSESAAHERGRTHGNRNREVVQRRQGLRLRHA